MATAIITGVSGQDGSYLAERLLRDGDRVIGLFPTSRAPGVNVPGVELATWDFTDVDALCALLTSHRPTEFYNFAAHSTGAGMYDDPVAIGELNGVAVARMLEGIRRSGLEVRFCQASSSEMFGDPVQVPQTEASPFRPLSPYGAAKLFAHVAVGVYRARHGMFACSAILYNHESPRRGTAFVTRKIARGVARIKRGLETELYLGNLEARRDWGYAPDYVRAMRAMLAAGHPDDFVVATGETHSVRDFCDLAFSHVGLDYREYVKEHHASLRHDGRAQLVGDASRIRTTLGWTPEVDFRTLVRLMVDAELAAVDATESKK